jgi:two-component system, sensor histidine kinase and response regulator
MDGHLIKPLEKDKLEKALIKYLIKKEKTLQLKKINVNDKNINVIDVRMGLVRFNYNSELYVKCIQKFLKYKNSHNEIVEFLRNNQKDEAIRLAHSIKGIAANLSIDKLSKSAHNLKEKLSNESMDSSYEIKEFTEILSYVIKKIENKEVFQQISNRKI